MTGAYFIDERRQRIVELLQAQERVTVKQLSALFTVTEDAIRKDLRYLESLKQLKRTYGGAVLPSALSAAGPCAGQEDSERRQSIARLAARLIEPGDTIFAESSGYTTMLLQEMPSLPNVTVVTNGIHGLAELSRKAKVIHIGGTVLERDEACYGFHALAALQHYHFDKCFMRTSGVGTDGMVTTSLPETQELKRALLPLAKHSILLVAGEQWDRQDRYPVGHLEEWSTVVTDSRDPHVLGRLQQYEVQVMAPEPAADSAS
ncbi:DeoR/GlpR family DNA-binding transcription regulator [Paenibacillus puerhi]|uniref:DeoR/GlpR family DNA-binding transcription regulator n=1 Tax=Paenibacillus puerhi TaxID=2692622 RepID=UPI0013583D18|nr:DeoR/GlpR family DNA-binding transcription regulator [Paenibacillus puerhi]